MEAPHSNGHFQKTLFFLLNAFFYTSSSSCVVFTRVHKGWALCVLCSLVFLCCLDFGVWNHRVKFFSFLFTFFPHLSSFSLSFFFFLCFFPLSLLSCCLASLPHFATLPRCFITLSHYFVALPHWLVKLYRYLIALPCYLVTLTHHTTSVPHCLLLFGYHFTSGTF